jgi:nitrogen regulatory protein P-II 1
MKKLEIIIPHRRLDDVSEILKDANTGGMSHYRIEGRGKIKAEPVAGEQRVITQNSYQEQRLR